MRTTTNGTGPGLNTPIKKAPGRESECARDNTNNAGNSNAAIAHLTAQLRAKGHHVHRHLDGSFTAANWGMSCHLEDFAELQSFAQRVGVTT